MNKNNSKTSLEINEKDLDSNSEKEKNLEKESKFKLKSIINKNRGHSDFGRQFTYKKKLENELDTLPKELSKFFRHSLDKYKFQLEVYVPHSMVISKKEYYHKNYMLNNLVRTEDIIKVKKNQIAPISKETKKFSHQYEFVRKENTPHQLNYLSKIEKMYQNKGFNTADINYKKDDNIFNPSFLLDSKYGSNSNSDVVKYGQNSYKREYKKDKWLLNKFDEYIQKRNKGGKNKETKEIKRNELSLEDDDDEKKKYLAQLKKELDEQIKIQNMTPKEYLSYSSNIKKEIDSIKSTINNFKELNDYCNKKSIGKIKIDKNKLKGNERYMNKSDKKIDESDSDSEKKKKKVIDFNSNIFLSSKGMKDYSKDKNSILPEINNSSRKKDNNNSLISQKKFSTKKKKVELKKNIIPKLLIKESINKNKEMEPIYLSERKIKEIQKERNLTELYDKLNNRTSNSTFPQKQINYYFTKYSSRRIPMINSDRGSNIHGLVEEVQTIIKDNNFAGFARLNNNAKRDIKYKKRNEENQNENVVDDDYIIDLDNKILGIHYDFTDKLLTNKKDQINIE